MRGSKVLFGYENNRQNYGGFGWSSLRTGRCVHEILWCDPGRKVQEL